MDIDRLPWESKVFVIQRKLRCHKRGIVSYTLWRKGLLGRSGFFFTLFFHIEICSTNLNEKPFISKVQHLSYPVFCTAKNQLVTTNSSLVDWILFTKAHDVSTKRPIGDSQVFLLFSFIQKFAVQIWMTRIKWWKAGVNASFVLLALRKYLRAKECILWWNGFSWDQCFLLFLFKHFITRLLL